MIGDLRAQILETMDVPRSPREVARLVGEPEDLIARVMHMLALVGDLDKKRTAHSVTYTRAVCAHARK